MRIFHGWRATHNHCTHISTSGLPAQKNLHYLTTVSALWPKHFQYALDVGYVGKLFFIAVSDTKQLQRNSYKGAVLSLCWAIIVICNVSTMILYYYKFWYYFMLQILIAFQHFNIPLGIYTGYIDSLDMLIFSSDPNNVVVSREYFFLHKVA